MTIYVGIKNDRFNEGTGWFVANDVNQGQVFNVEFYTHHVLSISLKFSPDINLNNVKNDDQQRLILSKETDSTTKVD